MKCIRQAVFAALALAFFGNLSVAQLQEGERPDGPPPGGPGGMIMRALDTDGDHEISAEEIANATSSLQTLDVNGDGKLSKADADRSPGPQRDRGPGQPGPRREDADRGQLERGGSGVQPNRQRRPRRAGHPGGEPPSPERFVLHAMEFDANEDGQLDAEELMQFAMQLGPPKGRPDGAGGPRGARPSGPRRQGRN